MTPAEQSKPQIKRTVPVIQTEKIDSLSTMATGMAHDLNNLLAAIIGNAIIINREMPGGSPLHKNAQQIVNSANRAIELTNCLQSYAGRGNFKLEKLEINSMVTDSTLMLRDSIHTGIDIKCELGRNIPLICGDPSQIKQVLLNIINNAAEAILEGQGSITISTGTLQTDSIPRDEVCLADIPQTIDYVYVEIKDTGCGMSPETIARMFDPFFTTKIRGHGLGLSAALGIIRAHGGGVSVKSEPQNGSIITVMFPACT